MITSREKKRQRFELTCKPETVAIVAFPRGRIPYGQSENFRKKRGTYGQTMDNTRSSCYPQLDHINSPFDHTASRKVNRAIKCLRRNNNQLISPYFLGKLVLTMGSTLLICINLDDVQQPTQSPQGTFPLPIPRIV